MHVTLRTHGPGGADVNTGIRGIPGDVVWGSIKLDRMLAKAP